MEITQTMTTPLPWPHGWVIYWPVVVALVEALALPTLILIGLLIARPILTSLLSSGGTIEAFGAKLSLAKKQVERETRALNAEVEDSIRAEEDQNEGAAPQAPIVVSPSPADPGQALEEGWTQLENAARDALKQLGAPNYIAGYLSRNPMWTFDWLVNEKWIGLALRDTIKSLLELRGKALDAMKQGQSILTQDAARDFNAAAQKSARALSNAVAYRIKKKADAAQPPGS